MPLIANVYRRPVTIRYDVRATGANGTSAEKGVSVVEAAAAAPKPRPPAIPPLTIVTTALSSATVGVAYSETLVASGGMPPYAWSIASGSTPAGVSLSPSGTITGTPTAFGQTSFTVQLSDSAGSAAATATLSISVVAPPTPTDFSTNWSGYIENGGPFTAVAGTFNVPNLIAASGSTTAAEWVGVDGFSAADPSLIQAGVTESYDPGTSLVRVHAWWEILPDAETPVALSVAPGNVITVTIGQVSAGLWGIRLTNDTTGQAFSTVQSYSGQGASAEWIVEAPTSAATGATDTLGDYAPNVTFRNLGTTGAETSLDEVLMVQGDVTVSTPSALTPVGFTVAYGSAAPPPPT